MAIVKPKMISLKDGNVSESVLQNYIYEDPSVLGLGELVALSKERRQPQGGRLDLLLTDKDGSSRYEVELQLGTTDPTHIIRTIEYWDVEKKRYPQYSHCAVLVAEEINGRFMNVISLFNGAIPIVAIQVSAIQHENNDITLVFTKIMDRNERGSEDEETVPTTSREDWLKHSGKDILEIMDTIFRDIQQVAVGYSLNYTKMYIGLKNESGISRNFVSFEPQKKSLLYIVKHEQTSEWDSKIDKSKLEYRSQWGKYYIRIDKANTYLENKEILIDLAKDAFLPYV